VLLHYVQNWQNYVAFSRGNLTFWRYQKLSRTSSVQDKRKHSKCEHFFELQQMFETSSTSLHVLSKPFSKTQDSFVLRTILIPCFYSATLNSDLTSDEVVRKLHSSFPSHDVCKEIECGELRWLLVLLNHFRQFACRHYRATCRMHNASRWICRSVRQQSVAVFNKLWKQRLINSYLKYYLPKSYH